MKNNIRSKNFGRKLSKINSEKFEKIYFIKNVIEKTVKKDYVKQCHGKK